MKFSIDRSRFYKLLTTVNVAIGSKSPTPAFLNFKLEMTNDGLTVLGSDNDLTIQSTLPIIENEKVLISNYECGSTLISAKYLLEIIDSEGKGADIFPYFDFFSNYINDISRYDTWLWKKTPKDIPTENYTTILIDSYGDIEKAYKSIAKEIFYKNSVKYSLTEVSKFNTIITVDMIKRQSYIQKYEKTAVYILGYNLDFKDPDYSSKTYALLILPDSYGNDIMESIYSKHKIDIVIGIYPSTRTLSFRKRPGCSTDLSRLAAHYGGGGHKEAAGAKLPKDKFIKFINKYYELQDENKLY